MLKVTNDYDSFLKRKMIDIPDKGISTKNINLNSTLFDFQKDIIQWGLRRGKAAVFTMTGTGKTFIQCEWAKHIYNHIKEPIIIFAPLAVSHQTIQEAKKLDIKINYAKNESDIINGINVTNYQRVDKFNAKIFSGVVLDESGILKSLDGKTRNKLLDSYRETPFKLACTATPAPNDFMELGNQAEFLNVMTYSEMLSMFFVHDGGHTSQWRLKKHAEQDYWNWIAKWAVILTKPSDLGYKDNGFILPSLNIQHIQAKTNIKPEEGFFIYIPDATLQGRQKTRRESVDDRIKKCINIMNSFDDYCLIWCNLNLESEKLHKNIKDSYEIKGSDNDDYKEKTMIDFANGKIKTLISKPSICGFGMNFQIANKIIFFGLSDSFEQYFQAIRRCWRFGQKKPVDVYIITSNMEQNVVKNIERKENDALKLINEMVLRTKETISKNLREMVYERTDYKPKIEMKIPEWLK